MILDAHEYAHRSEHFSPKELYDRGAFAPDEQLIHTAILQLAEAIRAEWGKPLRVNAGVRTQAKQQDLRRRGYRAARYSPHVWRCAIDFDTRSKKETRALVKAIKKASEETGIPCRIGYKKYMGDGMTFVHVDVAPVIAEAAYAAGQIPSGVRDIWSRAGAEW